MRQTLTGFDAFQMARRFIYAAIAVRPDLGMDDDPEAVAWRLASNGYDAETAAGECGLGYPMRPEALELAYWAGVHRWADRQRQIAARAAVDAGCPLRTAAELSGLSHQTVANLAGRNGTS